MTRAPSHPTDATATAAPVQVRFSLVLPAYNAGGTLRRAVDSVLVQSYANWELIIVDDGSTDDTAEIARGYERDDSRIRIHSQTNMGCGGARRAGALMARGEFVTKMDADDRLAPDALERLSAFIDAEPGYDIYSAHGYKVYSDGTQVEVFGDPKYRRPLSLTVEDLIDDCWIFGGAASIRRSTLERVGGFRAEVRCEDYDLWLRALAAGATHRFTPEHLYYWSMGVSGRMNENPIPSFRSYIEILNDLISQGLFTPSQVALARESVVKFAERIRQLEETGTTDADYTNRQAQRFKSTVRRVFGERIGSVLIVAVNRMKWLVKPIRVTRARRARLKDRG
jgi:glycosyltransferase involved in cell wall biosynthesis